MADRHSRREIFSSWLEALRGATRRGPSLDPEAILRPPGALLPDASFLEACSRCGACIEACPKDCLLAIEPDQEKSLPGIDPAYRPCHLCADLPCIAACPDGALADPGGPRMVRIGVARVDPRTCVTFRGEQCRICFDTCPYPHEAIMMIGTRPLVREGACTGCGLCVYACPTSPPSITVTAERRLVPGLRIPQEEYHRG